MLLVAMAIEGQGESFHLLSVINRSGSSKRINDENRDQISRRIGRRRCDYQIITEKIDVKSRNWTKETGFRTSHFNCFLFSGKIKKWYGSYHIISHFPFHNFNPNQHPQNFRTKDIVGKKKLNGKGVSSREKKRVGRYMREERKRERKKKGNCCM